MNKNIMLVTYGKVGYAYLAMNLALSVKATNKDYKVLWVCSANQVDELPTKLVDRLVDNIIVMDTKDYKQSNGSLDKCRPKVLMWKYAPKNELTVFVDADSIFLPNRNIDKIFDFIGLNGFYFNNVRYGTVNDKFAWGDYCYKYLKFLGLDAKAGRMITGVSSYIMGFDGTIELNSIVDLYEDFKASNLKYIGWQGNIPDEIIWQLYLTKIGYTVDSSALEYLVKAVFPNTRVNKSIIEGDHAFVTYVGKMNPTFKQYYRLLMNHYTSITEIPTPCTFFNKEVIDDSRYFESRKILFNSL